MVGAVTGVHTGVHTAVCARDLTETVVAPEPRGCGREGGAAGAHSGPLADGVHGVVILRNDGGANLVLLGSKDVAGGFPGVGDGVDRAGDGFEEVGIWHVAVAEGLRGRDVPSPYHGGKAAIGSGIAVGGLVLDGEAVLELEAGVAAQSVLAAVEDSGEVRGAVEVQVVGDGFVGEPEGGGIVGEGGGGDAIGDGLLAADLVDGDGDVRSGITVIGGGELSGGSVAIGGDDTSGPSASVEAAGRGVGVVGAFGVGVFLVTV